MRMYFNSYTLALTYLLERNYLQVEGNSWVSPNGTATVYHRCCDDAVAVDFTGE